MVQTLEDRRSMEVFLFFQTWSLWKVIAEFTTWFSRLIYMKLFQTSFADEELTQKGVRAIFPLTTGRNQKEREQWSISQNRAKFGFKILSLSWVVRITLNRSAQIFSWFLFRCFIFDHC